MRRLAFALAFACCLPPAAARAAAAAGGPVSAHPRGARQQQDARPKQQPTPTPRREGDGKDEGDEPQQLKRLDAERPAALARENAGKSEEQLVAEAVAESIRGALRKPAAGETRARGVLAKVDCTAKGLVFHVRSGRRVLRLHAAGFDRLHIMAFTAEAGGELTCGERSPESNVVVTYRAKADAKAKTDGSLAAVEFVPDDFQLKAAAATAARPAR